MVVVDSLIHVIQEDFFTIELTVTLKNDNDLITLVDKIYYPFDDLYNLHLKLLTLKSSHPFLLLRLCESPIETRFYFFSFPLIPGLIPQFSVSPYRLDFAIPEKKVAIELDGHEYHKTKAQRGYDYLRERNLQIKGWQIVRFTGSEVYQDIQGCISSIKSILTSISSITKKETNA